MRVTIATFLILGALAAPSVADAPFPVIGKVAPDFTLISQQDQLVRLRQFRGRLVLLNFIYTNCVDVCPITTASLQRVQQELIARRWWASDVVFVSVTTDPARDTPAVLRRYAQRYRADPKGWYFLTGTPANVRKVHAAYGIAVRPRGKRLQEHHLPTFVIDRAGTVLGAYGANPNPRDVLSDLEHLR